MEKSAKHKLAELKLAEARLTERDVFFTEEESKSTPLPYSQEVLLQAQRDRQFEPYCVQEQNFKQWYEEDRPLVGRVVISDKFIDDDQGHPNWQIASFSTGQTSQTAPKVRGDWHSLKQADSLRGLSIQSRIIQTVPTFSLRSLALQVNATFRLINDSSLWIFTRGNSLGDQNMAICKIKKQIDTRRVFLSLGSPIGPNGEFKFFKKLEMPEPDFSADAVLEDYADVQLRLTDNGNDKLTVKGTIQGKNWRAISLSCDKFIPVLDEIQVSIAGSGSKILMKTVKIKYMSRDCPINLNGQLKHECCSLM